MDEQMEMALGQAETVDPVSGNDVPPGSLPEEVRDDIDAKLSEGEYVVPADVVRFFGVKFFENLRTKAKQGLQQMDEDGRIGGEPTSETSLPFDLSELEVEDDDGMRMAVGGLIPGYAPGGFTGVGSSFGGYGINPNYKPYDPTIAPKTTTIAPPPVAAPAASANTGSQLKTYYDKIGNPVSVMFVNGKAQRSLQGLTTSNPNASGNSGPVDVNKNNAPIGASAATTDAKGDIYKKDMTAQQILETSNAEYNKSKKTGFSLGKVFQAGLGLAANAIAPGSGYALAATGLFKSGTEAGNYEDSIVGQEILKRQAGARSLNSAGRTVYENSAIGEVYDDAKDIVSKFESSQNFVDKVLNKILPNSKRVQDRVNAFFEPPVATAPEDDSETQPLQSAGLPEYNPKYTQTQSKMEQRLGITGVPRSEARDDKGNTIDKKAAELNWEDVRQLRSYDSAANRNKLAEWNDLPEGEGSAGSGGGRNSGSDKIVCTAMNESYGFGSFRNKIWLTHSAKHLTKAHQVGYHALFLPLIKLGYKKDYQLVRICLENIARHRTSDIYQQSKGSKRDTLGRMYRFALEPLCYAVGKIILLKGKNNGS